MNSEQTIPLLDIALLQGYIDSLGKNIVEQMFALYQQQAQVYLADIEKAQGEDAKESWQEHCHKMKGASASVGLLQLHKKLVVLEKTSASQVEKAELLTQLKEENALALQAFEEWLTAV
ncbi:Hpt domain-containing protein [Litorilituus lipolyticus]|uniref:Hpt domain-containing protein n=1 Tax=Litorilituus lipolyticus TaxID=2491017 RepID=UPI001FE54014|nr:Hpt domain-containing protein [Litorilituus lipolyticus]